MELPERHASPALKRSFGLVLLVLVPLALRLWPIDHGLPGTYVPDAHVVRNALGMARDRDLVPEMGTYSTYPYLVPYLLLPAYGAQFAAGRVVGAWSSTEEFGERLKEDPGLARLTARVLVAVMGALTPWVVFRGCRTAGLRLGAWVAAWLVATGLLHVHFSLQERPWIPMVFFGALAIWPGERYRREGRARWLLASGACAALAYSCHQAGLVMAGVPAVAWLHGPLGWRGRDLPRRLGQGAACAALFALVSLLAGYPYYLVHGATPADAAVRPGDLEAHFHVGGQAARFGFSWRSLEHLTRTFFGYDPSLCVLALIGLGPALRQRATRAVTALACVVAVVFFPYPNDHVRYLLPLSVLLAWPAGLGVERLLKLRLGATVASMLLVVPLVQAVRLGWVLEQPDTRAAASEALRSLRGAELIAIDHHGPAVSLDQDSLERLERVRELSIREAHRLELLRAGALPPSEHGLPVIAVEELFEGHEDRGGYLVREPVRERWGDTPAQVFATLGVTHVLSVDRRPGDGRRSPIGRLAEKGRLLLVIDPSSGERVAREALLPTEMDFPITGLWEVDHPGPWMAIHETRARERP